MEYQNVGHMRFVFATQQVGNIDNMNYLWQQVQDKFRSAYVKCI